jgi:type IV pilus assembly protein PilA
MPSHQICQAYSHQRLAISIQQLPYPVILTGRFRIGKFKFMHKNFRIGCLAIAAIALASACAPKATPTPTPTPPVSGSPAPLAPVTKSVEATAKTNARTTMIGQQAFYLEKNKFANSIDEIGIGMKTDTETYKYEVVDVKPKQVKITATAKKPELKSFTTSVFVVGGAGNELTVGVVCETDQPSQTPPEVSATPKAATEVLTCPAGSSVADKS